MATGLTEIIATIGLGIIGSLVAAEIAAYSPHITRVLIRRAVLKLSEADRERLAEEWLAHAAELPGSIAKLRHGIGCYLRAASSIRKLRAAPLWVRVLGIVATAYVWLRLYDQIVPMFVCLIRSGKWSTARAFFLSNRILVKTLVLERVYRQSDTPTVRAAIDAQFTKIRKILGLDLKGAATKSQDQSSPE